MIIPEITYNLDALKAACVKYGELSDKSESEVIAKQSAKLAWNIYRGLKVLAPQKGSIRAERLEAMAQGEGIKIRKSVLDSIQEKYGTKGSRGMSSYQLAVKKELSLRESARGFLAFSDPRPTSQSPEVASAVRSVRSRYGFELSQFALNVSAFASSKSASLDWDGSKGDYESAVAGLTQPRQQAVLAEAILATTRDINEYILRKIKEDKSDSGLS